MLWDGNVYGKSKVMRICRQPFLMYVTIDGTQPEYVSCLSSRITRGAKCTRGIKCKNATVQASCSEKKAEGCLLQQIGLKFKEETSEVLQLGCSFVKVLKIGHLAKSFKKNTCKVLRFGAG